MGSGGGGGGGGRTTGIAFGRPRPSRQPSDETRGIKGGRGGGGGGSGGGGGGDQCDLAFETDLAGVNPEVVATVGVGSELLVGLQEQGGFPTVVCRTEAGAIVGSLANVEDLAQLIACLQDRNRYTATVREVGSTYCTVFVQRI